MSDHPDPSPESAVVQPTREAEEPAAYAPPLYMDDLAERLKAHAGEPYQPSNGHEGEMFMSLWCYRCTKDNLDADTGEGGCPILAWTMAVGVRDPNYPREWQYSAGGQPVCAAFDPAGRADAGQEPARKESA